MRRAGGHATSARPVPDPDAIGDGAFEDVVELIEGAVAPPDKSDAPGLLSLDPATRVAVMNTAEDNPFFASSHADLALRAFELARLAERVGREETRKDAAVGRSAPAESHSHASTIWTKLPVAMPERRMRRPFDDLLAICWHHTSTMRDCLLETQSQSRAKRIVDRHVDATSALEAWSAESEFVAVRLLFGAFSLYNHWHKRVSQLRRAMAPRPAKAATRSEPATRSESRSESPERTNFDRFERSVSENEDDCRAELQLRVEGLRRSAGSNPKRRQGYEEAVAHLQRESTADYLWEESEAYKAWQRFLRALRAPRPGASTAGMAITGDRGRGKRRKP